MNKSSHNTGGPVIVCDSVARTYSEGPGKLTIFQDISLSVAPGEI